MAAQPWEKMNGADMKLVTSSGRRISVHSRVLAPVSSVFAHMIPNPAKKGSVVVVPILGVPDAAVVAFLKCIYSSRKVSEEEMEKYRVHLLVLSHVLHVTWLKRAVTVSLVESLATENVVDMLQLSRQCDAPRLYVRCMNMLRRHYKAVEKTEGWKFVQKNDPLLELEVLQFFQQEDDKEKLRRKAVRERQVYADLSETMECLRHICTDGCAVVGPRDQPSPAKTTTTTCRWGSACERLQELICHFALCENKNKKPSLGNGNGGGCVRCSRMWYLLRLHATICDDGCCKVPLCSRFKEMEGGKKEDKDWTVLAKKVLAAKVISVLNKRKREDLVHEGWPSKRR